MTIRVSRPDFILAFGLVACSLTAHPANAQLGGLFGSKPVVPEIKVDELRKLKLSEAKKDSPYVLVDVRTKEESSVSLLPGAITKFEYELHPERYKGRTVIAYCTSGYRSGQYAQKLVQQGAKAKNFKGSILEWCRTGLPLVSPEGEPTNRVHTYSSKNKVPDKYDAIP